MEDKLHSANHKTPSSRLNPYLKFKANFLQTSASRPSIMPKDSYLHFEEGNEEPYIVT